MQHADPVMKRALADTLVERTAQQLAEVLREMASALEPFPHFLNMPTIQAVEVEPGKFRDPQRGCVVVCPDGELYELSLRLLSAPPELGGLDQVEEYKPLELTPVEHVVYAHGAIQALAWAHQERTRAGPGPQ